MEEGGVIELFAWSLHSQWPLKNCNTHTDIPTPRGSQWRHGTTWICTLSHTHTHTWILAKVRTSHFAFYLSLTVWQILHNERGKKGEYTVTCNKICKGVFPTFAGNTSVWQKCTNSAKFSQWCCKFWDFADFFYNFTCFVLQYMILCFVLVIFNEF